MIQPDTLYVRLIDSPAGEMKEYLMNSCIAHVAEGTLDGKMWATIYDIQSMQQGKGHATKLLTKLKEIYKDYEFGGTIALSASMKHLYKKLDIKEYDED